MSISRGDFLKMKNSDHLLTYSNFERDQLYVKDELYVPTSGLKYPYR